MFAKPRLSRIIPPMRSHSLLLLSSTAAALALSGCANSKKKFDPDDPLGTGPFDAHGNYIEEWADDPSKWRNRRGRETQPAHDLPQIAKNEEPPAHSTPLAAANPAARQTPAIAQTSPKPQARPQAQAKPKPKPAPKPKPKPSHTVYTVKKGDTLSAIASRHRSSVAAIQRANGISGSLIRPGQRLKIPAR